MKLFLHRLHDKSLMITLTINMQISIIKPGVLTTIQDMGRFSYLSQAVPISGAMDMLSARIANKALGNPETDATIEFTYATAKFEAKTDLLIAYAGDGAFLNVDQQKLLSERPIFVPAGSIIKLTNNQNGARTYLAIAGGWQVPEILGSKSTYLTANFGGLEGRNLKTGDTLNNNQLSEVSKKILDTLKSDRIKQSNWYIPKRLLLAEKPKTIRIMPAQERTWFCAESVINFLSSEFTIGLNSNRMGYQLTGVNIKQTKKKELLSTAVSPGTIQVTGNGNLIILMADCQTTGGYPRIGQVAAVDLPLCAQLKAGDKLHFLEISRDEAENLYLEQEKQLFLLTLGITSKF